MDSNINGTATMTWSNAMQYFRTGDGKNFKTSWTNVLNIDLPKAQAIADNTYNNSTWNNGSPWLADTAEKKWFCFGTHKQDMSSSPWCNSTSNTSYMWMANNLDNGYWTRDLIYNTTSAWYVYKTGLLSECPVNQGIMGVRPVVTVLKTALYD